VLYRPWLSDARVMLHERHSSVQNVLLAIFSDVL
jgi:hypothetical protein